MRSVNIKKIKKDLAILKNQFEIVLYGSHVEGGVRPNSDIDIAIITRERNEKKNLKIQKDVLGLLPLKYDIRVFELLPIHIQIAIIKNHLVIHSDPLEISEYFYQYRKKWEDCKHRILSNQFKSFRERLSIIEKIQENKK